MKYKGGRTAAKQISLTLILVLGAVLQNTEGALPVIGQARFFVLLPLVACIGVLEGDMSGLVFGALAGAMWDVCDLGFDGFRAFWLALTGCVAGILVRFRLREKVGTAYAICAVSTLLYCLLDWFFTVSIPLGDKNFSKLLWFYMGSFVYTVIPTGLVYLAVRAVRNAFSDSIDLAAKRS